jgi:hypothetical protein
MLQPSGRRDWWTIPIAWAKALDAGIPGILANDNKTCLVHRSHLPLLRAAGLPVPLPPDGVPIDGVGDLTFRPWQRRAYAWAEPRRGTLLVAEPRMGKTLISLSLHDPKRGPLVVLAPLDVRQVWVDWITRVFPGADVLCLEGRTVDVDAVRNADFIFCHYDIVAHQQMVALAPGTLIIDEAHLLSNASSQRSKGVRDFAVLAKRVIVLTGTPLWNATRGLWPLLAMTNPGAWGKTPFLFNQRHCSPTLGEYGWIYGEISNEEEWRARHAEVVFQATWQAEHPELPPTQRSIVDVDVDATAYGELDIAAESLRDVNLRDNTIGAIARYRKVAAMLKVQAVAAAALALPAPSVIWSWHKDVAKAIAKAVKEGGRNAYMIHGDEKPVAKRLATLDVWRDDPQGVLSATLAVGQVGIDLSHAADAFNAEVDWTPAVLYQADMRTFDPRRVMRSTFFRVRHPVEQLLVDKLVEKLARGVASAMPAAGSGFDLSTTGESEDALLAALNEIVSGGSRHFSGER